MTDKHPTSIDLTTFQKGDKWGLKNALSKVLVAPIYEEIHIVDQAIVALRLEVDQEGEEVRKIDILNLSGHLDLEATKKLSQHNIESLLEIWPLGANLFGFQHINWDSLELTGVFNIKGELVIKPDYDEVERLSDCLLLCFHGEHYEEYDSLGVKNYGNKLFNNHGRKLEAESIKEYEELENGNYRFVTNSGAEFLVDRSGNVLI